MKRLEEISRRRNRRDIAAGISLAIISNVNGTGGKLNSKFASLNNSLK
jgi:hypothetical protein